MEQMAFEDFRTTIKKSRNNYIAEGARARDSNTAEKLQEGK